jgi:hypothetical protein
MIATPDVWLLKIKADDQLGLIPLEKLEEINLMFTLTLTNFRIYSHILIFASLALDRQGI